MGDKDRCICYVQCATQTLHLSPPRTQTHMRTQWVTVPLQHSDHSWVLTFSHASNLFTKVQTGGTNLSLFLQCKPLINSDADQTNNNNKIHKYIHFCVVLSEPHNDTLLVSSWISTLKWTRATTCFSFPGFVTFAQLPPWKDFSEEFDSWDKLGIAFDSLWDWGEQCLTDTRLNNVKWKKHWKPADLYALFLFLGITSLDFS